jgi:hypothetical protein
MRCSSIVVKTKIKHCSNIQLGAGLAHLLSCTRYVDTRIKSRHPGVGYLFSHGSYRWPPAHSVNMGATLACYAKPARWQRSCPIISYVLPSY